MPPGPIERWLSGRNVTLAIIAVGIMLRVWQYASNITLWMDEIVLTRNILGLPLSDLMLRPLYFDQVAPRGFLLVEKLVTLILGPSELALRLFPLLVSIVGAVLFWRVSERILAGLAVPFAVFVFAIGIPFVRYAAEVKQYGPDVAVAIGLVLLALDLRDREPSARRLWLSGLAGFVLVWFSQTAVLVLAGLGLALAVEWLITRDPRLRGPLFITVPVWAVGCLLAVVAGLRSMTPATREFLDEFWRAGFLPLPVSASTSLQWLWERLVQVFSDVILMRYPLPGVYVMLAVLGLLAIWRTRRYSALVLVGPLVVAILAAVAQQYPLRSRLVLYLVPGLLIAAAAGAEWLRRSVSRLSPALGGAAMIACLALPVLAVVKSPPPYVVEEYRPMLAYLRDHRQPGDSVYVIRMGHAGMMFYGPRYGIERRDWRMGDCDRDEARPYLRDVDRYRGVPRLWVVTTGLRPYLLLRKAIHEYLGTIGVRRDSLFTPSYLFGPVGLELYDLSDSIRLRAASAQAFPVDTIPKDLRPVCRDWTGAPRVEASH